MNTQLGLFLVNGIFGTGVLFSYIWGVYSLEDPSQLWGNMPLSYINYIIISMFLSTIGYISYTFYIAFGRKIIGLTKPFLQFNITYLIILISASLWMPLTVVYLNTDLSVYWILDLMSLYTVGIMSCYMTYILIKSTTLKSKAWKNLSIIGSLCFTFHTLVLDAILWAIYFH